MAGRRPNARPAKRATVEAPSRPPGLPNREELRAFVAASGGRVGKKEISRHFGLGPADRVALKGALRDLAADGSIAPAGHRRFASPGHTNEATVVEITGTDPDGDAIGRPIRWDGPDRPPLILMAPEQRGAPALAPGARVLARLKPIGPGKFEGRTIKRLEGLTGRILGVFRETSEERRAHAAPPAGRITPTDRRARAEWIVPAGEAAGAEPGEIVRAEPLPYSGYGLKPARILERLGQLGDARSVSLIVIATLDIPVEFRPDALTEAAGATALPLGTREDLRAIPLITIDGEDARDFDDAVHAEPDGDGFRLLVAIADVAAYVRPAGPLDRDAASRGNSVYFPDRVVPMLPEALSNGWCSLRPHQDRGCLFVEMTIDATGRKTAHRFGRGLMRSAARMTYEQVQQAQDTDQDGDLPKGVRVPLYAAFATLLAARQQRGTLDLDLPERRVLLDQAGRVQAIVPRPRLDSHRLIEEFMVLANVSAAEELERLRQPCIYRVHAPPSPEKLANLRTFLATLGISLPPGDQVHPRDLDRVLQAAAGTEHAIVVNETMLRSQSQAQYDIDNIGHFGLALSRYAHFTSPIRRYADLEVHRALIRGLKLGDGGLTDPAIAALADTAAHITTTERRAAVAERDAIDRYMSAFMADKVGAVFAGRISGVTRFGLFVTLAETGASGIVPMSSLDDDFWVHDETQQALVGRRTGKSWRLAQAVEVRLHEATPLTGGLSFSLVTGPAGAPKPDPFTRRGRRH
jgi:ribonuclease R